MHAASRDRRSESCTLAVTSRLVWLLNLHHLDPSRTPLRSESNGPVSAALELSRNHVAARKTPRPTIAVSEERIRPPTQNSLRISYFLEFLASTSFDSFSRSSTQAIRAAMAKGEGPAIGIDLGTTVPTRASACGSSSTTGWRSSPTTRATAPRRPMSPSPTPSGSSATPPRTRSP